MSSALVETGTGVFLRTCVQMGVISTQRGRNALTTRSQ
jgi:hypothetical protein